MTANVIEFEQVTKRYRRVLAVDGLSLTVAAGSVYGLIGPNGAGKTTTIKMLVGLLNPTAGSITVGGHRMPAERHEVHRLIGYLSQDTAFQSWRTAYSVLRTFGLLSEIPKTQLGEAIERALDAVGLGDLRHRRVDHLSGGMVRRLGLAQAILHRPRLLVLDEPLAGLDPANRAQVRAIVGELLETGITVLFSSHILSDVQDVATHIGILNEGRLLLAGTIDELRRRFSVGLDLAVELSQETPAWEELPALAGVSHCSRTGPRRILVHLEEGSDYDGATHEVIQALIAGGCRIRSLAPVTPSLDDIYARIVKGAPPPLPKTSAGGAS